MVSTTVKQVVMEELTRQMEVKTWSVTPSIVNPKIPDVRANLEIHFYEPGMGYGPVMGAPVMVTVTKPNGDVFFTQELTTDANGAAAWIITLDQIGTWEFKGYARDFESGGYQFLGCADSPLNATMQENGGSWWDKLLAWWNTLPWWQQALLVTGGVVGVTAPIGLAISRSSQPSGWIRQEIV